MNIQTATTHDLLKEKYFQFKRVIVDIREEREKLRAAIAEERTQLQKYAKNPEDWGAEIRNRQGKIGQLEEQMRVQNERLFASLLELSGEVVDLAVKKANEPFDLNDGETAVILERALSLASNAHLSYADASDIAAQFKGNQRVLKLLGNTFSEKGILSNIGSLIYDPEALRQHLQGAAFHVALQDGSPETFLSFMERNLAQYEGIAMTPKDANEVGSRLMEEAARRGAGLV